MTPYDVWARRQRRRRRWRRLGRTVLNGLIASGAPLYPSALVMHEWAIYYDAAEADEEYPWDEMFDELIREQK